MTFLRRCDLFRICRPIGPDRKAAANTLEKFQLEPHLGLATDLPQRAFSKATIFAPRSLSYSDCGSRPSVCSLASVRFAVSGSSARRAERAIRLRKHRRPHRRGGNRRSGGWRSRVLIELDPETCEAVFREAVFRPDQPQNLKRDDLIAHGWRRNG
jgi:hypothetical protein